MTRPIEQPIDDTMLEELVRDTVGGWEMPSTRLDRGWRSRVRTRRGRSADIARGFVGRVGRAAGAGIALTVAAALLAVALTGPRTPVGSSGPSASSAASGTTGTSPRPSATSPVAATPLPRLFAASALPIDPAILVRVDGDYAIADLSTGTLGKNMTSYGAGSALRKEPGGGYLCLCVDVGGASGKDAVRVRLVRYDAAGLIQQLPEIASYSGDADPRGATPAEAPRNVDIALAFDPDGRHAYIGWTKRVHPVWRSGIDVVDLTTGSIVAHLAAPDHSDGEGDARTVAFAPVLVGRDADGSLILGRGWYGWSPAAASNPTYTSGTDVLLARKTGSAFADAAPLPGADGCGESLERAGVRPGGGIWLDCTRPRISSHVLRRIDPAGGVVGDAVVNVPGGVSGTTALAPDGRTMYSWDPLGFTLTSVDVADGTVRKAEAARPTAAAIDPLRAFGSWLAPTAAAKVMLDAGIAVSPDGRTAYALGLGGPESGDLYAGSAGVFVFDLDSMQPSGHWDAPADLVSVAVTSDGSTVLAAGAPGVDAAGTETGQQASIVAFDVHGGKLVLVAGQMGRAMLTFPATVVAAR